MIVDEEVYLEHFGVSGMKWGVRNSSKSRPGDSDVTLKKGRKVYNISSDTERSLKDSVYTAYKPRDIMNYRGNYASNLKEWKGADKVFSNAFQVTSTVKAAGRQTQVEAFKKLWEKDKAGVAKALAEAQKDMKFSAAFNARVLKLDRTDKYQKRFMNKGEKWVSKKGPQEMNASLSLPDNSVKQKYFKELEKRGYNAVVDLNDIKNYGSQEPLLIFKGSKNLKKKSAVELTEKDITTAYDLYDSQKKLDLYRDQLHK